MRKQEARRKGETEIEETGIASKQKQRQTERKKYMMRGTK
jgi:hypothetical protein